MSRPDKRKERILEIKEAQQGLITKQQEIWNQQKKIYKTQKILLADIKKLDDMIRKLR